MKIQRVAAALTIGLLVSGSSTYLLSRRLVGNVAQQIATLKYASPSHSIEAGELLKAEDFAMIDWPASTPIAGAFTKPAELVGRSLLYPLEPGQPITAKFLTATGTGAGLAWKIPDGMRAIALRSDEIVGVAGFLQPDSHVDVLATVRTDKNPDPTTFTVLQNAQVLAAGHQMQPDPEGKPASVTVVTLLLSPADAERAVLASLQGSIHFVLRSGSDKIEAKDAPVNLAQLVAGHVAPENGVIAPSASSHVARSTPSTAKPERQFVVDTIAGDKQTSETFRVGQQ